MKGADGAALGIGAAAATHVYKKVGEKYFGAGREAFEEVETKAIGLRPETGVYHAEGNFRRGTSGSMLRDRVTSMRRIRGTSLLLVALLSAGPGLTQGISAPTSKVVSGLSPEQIQTLNKPYDVAAAEIWNNWAAYSSPDIAGALTHPRFLVSIVAVTGVQPPTDDGPPYTRVRMHVEQTLRGISGESELRADSSWRPMPPEQWSKRMRGGPHETVLDIAEPRIGDRLLLAYTLFEESEGPRAWVVGGFNLGDQKEARIFSEVQRVLGMEAAAGTTSVAPYVGALDDTVPWIRDLAARQLINSPLCSESPPCVESFVRSASQLLGSKIPQERYEGVRWLEPLAKPIGIRRSGPNGLPSMSNWVIRELIASTVNDANVMVGDQAFSELQLFDFFHSAGPGQCIAIVPRARKAIRGTHAETENVQIGGPFGSTNACTSDQ